MTDEDDPTRWMMQALDSLSSAFTPRTPVAKRDRFAGRISQVMDVTSALNQPGTHVVLYGERGVGKTSLANVLGDFLSPLTGAMATVRLNCGTTDTYRSVWSRVFREMNLEVPESWRFQHPEPDEVRLLLQRAPSTMIILDEFDRLEDDESLSLMADTIKALSDHQVESKLVIVGVADSIDQLIGEHESVQRAIEEVSVPRMTTTELTSIIDNGLESASMSIEPGARRSIGRLAEGLPHFVHLLTLNAGKRALHNRRDTVIRQDVEAAITQSVQKHSLLRDYQTAVQSSRPDNLFARVLTACALAEKNRLGYFSPPAVREPFSRIMGRQYEIPAFSPHLKAFTDPDRGSVLKREGPQRRYTYRFRNPLLQPFTLLTAVTEGLLPRELYEEFFSEAEDPQLFITDLDHSL